MPDIDIDLPDRNKALIGLPYVAASMAVAGALWRHQSGVYFQDIPVDPTSGIASLDYVKAEEYGYFKVDFLNSSLYEGVEDEEHLLRLLHTEPDWSLFEHAEIVDMLNHVREHFGVVRAIRPKSIEDLAVVLALIRPGKRHLMGLSRAEIDKNIWTPDEDGYYFKRAHAISYAASIVVQLNLICEGVAKKIDAEVNQTSA